MKKIFSDVRSLVLISVFIALGTILMMIEIPYPPVPFLKFDLSELIVLLTVEIFGLMPALLVAFFKSFANVMLGLSATPMHIGAITAFIASTVIAVTYSVVKRWIPQLTLKAKIVRYIIVISVFTSVLTICNYLFITPIYFGGLWYTDVMEWATLDAFIPGLSFNLGYGAAIAFVYIPFNMLKGIMVLALYELMSVRLLGALKKTMRISLSMSK